MYRHVFDAGGCAGGGKEQATRYASLGQPSRQIIMFEDSAFHAEKLPLYGGVSPSTKPIVPPETRTVNCAFADGHVKVFRLNYKTPSWDPNHDMNWFLASPSNCDLGSGYDP